MKAYHSEWRIREKTNSVPTNNASRNASPSTLGRVKPRLKQLSLSTWVNCGMPNCCQTWIKKLAPSTEPRKANWWPGQGSERPHPGHWSSPYKVRQGESGSLFRPVHIDATRLGEDVGTQWNGSSLACTARAHMKDNFPGSSDSASNFLRTWRMAWRTSSGNLFGPRLGTRERLFRSSQFSCLKKRFR